MKNGQNVKPVRNKNKATWWKYLLAFFGGFGFCITAFAIGVAFTGRAVRMKDVVSLAGGDPNEYIGVKYQNETIEGMIRSIIGGKFETLGDINEVTPLIKKTLDENINPMLDRELHYQFNWEELKTKPFVLNTSSERPDEEYDHTISIGDYIPKDMKEHIYLASFVVSSGTNPEDLSGIMKLFLYPYTEVAGEKVYDYTSPYSIADIMAENFFQNKINSVTIGDVLPSGSSNPFLDQMKNWTLSDFSDAQLRTLKIGLLFSDEMRADNPLLNTIYEQEWTINDLTKSNIEALKICEILDTTSATGLLAAIKDNTIAEITSSTFINGLLLEDIFTNPTGILKVMADKHYTVGDLNDESKILALTVDEIFSPTSSDLLYSFRTYQLSELSSLNVSDVKLADIVDMSSNAIFQALYDNNPNVTIGDLSDPATINSIPISSIISPGTNKVLLSLVAKGTTIGSIATDINSLTLKEVIEIDTSDPSTPPFLIALKDTNINNLGSALTGLKVKDVMNVVPGDAYKDTSVSPFDFYIRKNNKWVKVTDATEYTTETNDYLGTEGFKNKGKAVVFEENGAPTDSYHSGDAVNRDPLYAVRNVGINDSTGLYNGLKDSLMTSLTLRDVIDDIDHAPAVLKALADENIGTLPDKLKTLTLNEILGTTSSSSPILSILGGVTVFGDGENNLEFALDHLNLVDVIGESAFVDPADDTKTRNAVKVNVKLVDDDFEGGNIKTGAGTIKSYLDDVDDDFDTVKHLDNVRFVYDKELKRAFVDCLYSTASPYSASSVNASIAEMYQFITGTAMTSAQLSEITDGVFTFTFHDHECTITGYKACEIETSYWFLFSEDGEDFDAGYKKYILRNGLTYTINDMDKLTSNMTYHMQNETLFDLSDAGFIDTTSIDLTKTLKDLNLAGGVVHITIPYAGEQVGNLTVKQLLDVVAALLPYISD